MNWKPTIPRCDWPKVAGMGATAAFLGALIWLFTILLGGCAAVSPDHSWHYATCPVCGQQATANEVYFRDGNGHQWFGGGAVSDKQY